MLLGDMPEWAQEMICNHALGLLADEDASWTWKDESRNVIAISAHGYTYHFNPNTFQPF